MEDNKFWLCLWLGLATIGATALIGTTALNNMRTQSMIKSGYEYGPVPYSESKVFIDWHKPEATK